MKMYCLCPYLTSKPITAAAAAALTSSTEPAFVQLLLLLWINLSNIA